MKHYKPTNKQIRSLYFILPGPLGLGMSMREAGRVLGLAPSAVYQQLKSFKRHHPEAGTQIDCMLNTMYRQGRNLVKPLTINRIGWRKFLENKIIEKF